MPDRLKTLLKYLDESPDDAFLLFAIAREYTGRQDYGLARTWYQRLRELHPNYVGLYYHLGKLEQEHGSREEAMRVFEAGLQVANSIGDQHAWSELNAALTELRED